MLEAAQAGIALDDAQRAAVAHAFGAGALALCGAPGTGKSVTLVRRALHAATLAPPGRVFASAPSDAGVARLRRALAAVNAPAIACSSFGDLAFSILRERAKRDARPGSVDCIDEVRAAQHFERVGAALFALEWTELVTAEIDPEVTGLRAPQRFAAAAFRLIRKLRAGLVSPAAFTVAGLRGATEFYGRPPNFNNTELLLETPAKYRDSLRVDPAELERQRTREVDLVHVLGRLYASYVAALVDHGCLTPADAVYEATTLLRSDAVAREQARRRFTSAFIDDAQDLTAAQAALLAEIFGPALAGVTLAGDDAQSTRAFAGGGRGGPLLKDAADRIVLERNYRCAPAIERIAARGLTAPASPGPPGSRTPSNGGDAAVVLYRADSAREEARYVAREVAALLEGGTLPARIALITRNLGCAHAYVDALLARNVAVDVGGAASPYAYPAVTDALAALWSLADPFRHDYLLRSLEAPWMRLADASIAILCGESSCGGQPPLFELGEDDTDEARGGRRWDRRRDLRLGRNVTRGDVDGDLPPEARERLAAFRAARDRWQRAARRATLGELTRLILDDTALATLPDDARGRFERGLLERLLHDVDAFEAREPLASLDDFLAHAERVADAEADLLTVAIRDPHAVRVLDVEAAKGEEFDVAFVVDVRAGAWPRYYVPDAFLFMPSAGMIPKDNVGDARATRTVKFTYSSYRYKLSAKYNAEERRAFYCAATRARTRLYVTASGRPTRGVSAPEILAELERG